MSPATIGFIGILVMIALFMLNMPISFAMVLVGFVGLITLTTPEAALSFMARDIFNTFSSYSLSVIPMFIIMGTFAFASGISQRLFKTTYTWIGHWTGGMTIATVFASAGFGAICGSSTATAATMGKISLPEMKKYKYDDSLATGTVAAAGTLGILIPPSTVLIVYGILTEESIGKLFVAGVLPGIILSIFFAITVFILCKRNPAIGPKGPKFSWKERLRALAGILESLLLFLLTIGGLFAGWFSPTQAGAIGAAGALVIGLARRQLTWKAFVSSAKDGLRTSCMVLFIIMGATVFAHFMAVTRIPFLLADWLGGLAIPPMAVMGVIIVIYFIGGFFMDAMGLIVVTIPIFYPVVEKLGVDPIWFGVIIVLISEMGVITPPVGVNVFVIKGIAPEIPLQHIFKGIFPFLIALLVFTVILLFVPQIATFLPSLASY